MDMDMYSIALTSPRSRNGHDHPGPSWKFNRKDWMRGQQCGTQGGPEEKKKVKPKNK